MNHPSHNVQSHNVQSHNVQLPSFEASSLPPRINLLTMFRLGLFQMGLGVMSLLTLGVLNRLMIGELQFPAFLTACALAMAQLVAPARIWFGQMSDAKPLWNFHRTGYVWIGSILFTTISFLTVQVIWQLDRSAMTVGWEAFSTYAWAGILAAMFAAYGLALSASSTPYAALLVDITDEDDRPKLIAIVWSLLMVGIVIGAVLSSVLLDSPEVCGAAIATGEGVSSIRTANLPALQGSVNRLFSIVLVGVVGMTFLATVGVEKTYSRYSVRSSLANREDQVTLPQALRVLTANRQTGIFFTFLLMMTLSLFVQDPVMEPYGGEVFGMCISETTRLNAYFGMGTLVGLSSSGFLLVPRIGKSQTVVIGCAGAAVCVGLYLFAGVIAQPQLLMVGLLLYGLFSGVLTAGATSLMLDLTAAETAGTFIGAWGLAQAIARGLATVTGGGLLSVGKSLFTTPLMAYGLVFGVQALGLVLAIVLLRRVNIQEFQDSAKRAIATVFEGDLE